MAESEQDGFVTSESTFIVLSIVAIILLAAVFPTFNIFSTLSADSVGGGTGTPDKGGSGSLGGGTGNVSGNGSGIKSGGGKPGQSDLSPPPEKSKIAGGMNASRGRPLPLFVAKGAGRQYWRQSAYMTYTGTAWERSTDVHSIQTGVPNDRLTRDGKPVEYKVKLLTPTTSLPTVWQPETVEVVNHSSSVGLEVSTVGGIQSSQTLEEGSTYVGVSHKPPTNPAILRESEGTYPETIETTYTQLPAATPERVEEFGDQLTADANSPYEAAVTIRNWLRSNKEYSLNTSIDPSKPIADQFLFEVDRGYCQHFATTMTVLLRTQDIPARYVVGFAGGRPVGEGEYLVTSKYAHAWVEVYFADVGWVTFDPTAASDRDISTEPPQPPYNISLNRSAVAGASVSIQVTKNGSAVVGAPVYVEGERIGWTDLNGEVTTRLPWERNITIVARMPGSASRSVGQSDDERTTSIAPAGHLPPPRATPQLRYAVNEPSVNRLHPSRRLNTKEYAGGGSRTQTAIQTHPVLQTTVTLNQTAKNYTAETNVTIDLPKSVRLGETVSLKATIKDVPLRNATIAIDGKPIGKADRNGTFKLTFNNTSLGRKTVSASRGKVTGTTTIFVKKPPQPNEKNTTNESAGKSRPRTINVSVSPLLGFPVPFGPATVNVTADSGPVEGALISVNGNTAGNTSANGTVQIRFPLSRSATVSAIGPEGATAEKTVTNLYRNAAALLSGIVITALVIVLVIRRLEGPIQRVRHRLFLVTGMILDVFLHLAEVVAAAGYWLQSALQRLWARIRTLSLSEIIATIQSLTFSQLIGIKNRVLAVVYGLMSYVRELFQEQADSIRSEHPTDADSYGAESRFVDLWQEFISIVQPPHVSTRTPGEIGRYAVRRGFPEGPVKQFVQWYRGALYSPESETTSRIDRARNYLSSIRDGDDRP